MGAHSAKNDITIDSNGELSATSPSSSQPQPAPTTSQCQLEFEHPPRVTCDHGWNDGPAFITPNRESSSDEDENAAISGLNVLIISSAQNLPTKTGIAATDFPKFDELPTEVRTLIFHHAVEISIGSVRRALEFLSDLWYTETSLFSTGCTNYPHYMTYHNGGVGTILPPCPPLRLTRQWVGIGSKAIFKDIMHASRLSRQVCLEYWRESVEKCLGEYVKGDENRKGMDLEGRPINYWMMRALQRRELVLEALGEMLRGMRATGGGQ